MTASLMISKLMAFAQSAGLLSAADRFWAYNALAELMNCVEPPTGCRFADSDWSVDSWKTMPAALLDPLVDRAVEKGLCDGRTGARERFADRLMGVLCPRPSAVVSGFEVRQATSPQAATDWLYELQTSAGYIRRDRMARNLEWRAATPFGDLQITVNLSKPEKDPRDIAAASVAPVSGYPACVLCRENEGFAGDETRAPRHTLRLIPLTLGGESWFFQYSPYGYYYQHAIVLSRDHRPMRVDRRTFTNLLEFIDAFPHFFVGSNADLPVVGGSILNHDHYQAGQWHFPIESATVDSTWRFDDAPDVDVTRIRWPLTVLRLRSTSSTALVDVADRILAAWRGYSDPACGLLASTNGTPHHTVTPMARRWDGGYELDLALRDNRATAEHPLGIFHPHEDVHHIKKENIGLIEVMGLAILPPRLKGHLERMEAALASGRPNLDEADLALHADWYARLASRFSGAIGRADARQVLRDAVGAVFAKGLADAGVYKWDDAGIQGFARFMVAQNARWFPNAR